MPTRKLAVALDLSYDYHRRMIAGMRQSRAVETGQVQLYLLEGPPFPPKSHIHAQLDGVIVRIAAHESQTCLRPFTQLPLLRLYRNTAAGTGPIVSCDFHAGGRQAVEHLRACGYKQLALACSPISIDLKEFQRGVMDSAAIHKLSLTEMPAKQQPSSWLRQLVKPVGIICSWDKSAALLVRLARQQGLRIPEDLAVIGMGNDNLQCTLADVPLSSIDIAPEQVGEQAITDMLAYLQGKISNTHIRTIPPKGIHVRKSTAVIAQDEQLTIALNYIRDHACSGMRIHDMEPLLAISRRSLELRFRAQFGRSLHDEIRRVQLQRACDLLSDRRHSITQVSDQTGFCDAIRFATVFKSHFGLSPSQWRKHYNSQE